MASFSAAGGASGRRREGRAGGLVNREGLDSKPAGRTAAKGQRLVTNQRQTRLSSLPYEPFFAGAIALAVVVATAAGFYPALRCGFVNFDDESTLPLNEHFRGLSREQLRWMFTTTHMGHYQPLAWVTFALDYLAWELNPKGYHLTNVVLHTLNAWLFLLLARRLLGLAGRSSVGVAGVRNDASWAAAGLAALIFALHPLRVESVAWATQRRDVLSAVFFLATILIYLRAVAARAHAPQSSYRLWMAAALALSLLAVLSKAIGAMLPAILLLLDVYPLRRLSGASGGRWSRARRRVYLEKVPFLVPAAAVSVMAVYAQGSVGTLTAAGDLSVAGRLYIMVRGFAFYPWKTLLPLKLAPLYELPLRPSWADSVLLAAALGVLGVTLVAVFLRRRLPALAACWAAYLILLFPVSGLFQSGPQLAADRYSYLSCASFALLLGGASLKLAGRFALPVRSAAFCGLVALGMLTRQQIGIWRNGRTLWEAVIARYPDTSMAYMNRATLFLRDGDLLSAEADLRKCLTLWPTYAEALSNLSYCLMTRGMASEAVEAARRAIELKPGLAPAHAHLGTALYRLGQEPQAIDALRQALRLNEGDWQSRLKLADLLSRAGRRAEAVEQAALAARSAPDQPIVYELLAVLYRQQGRTEPAIGAITRAIELAPTNPEAWILLGELRMENGEREAARRAFRRALELRPDHLPAQRRLERTGRHAGTHKE